MAAPDQNDAKARPLSLAFSSRDKNWLPSFKRIISGRSVIRFLTRPTRGSTSRPPVTFSRQRQAVAISPYARYVVSDNEFYSSSMSSDSQQTAYLQICDSCKSSINWYFGNLSRQVTELILHSQPIGTFLVRNSSSKYGTYALSVRVAQDAERPTAVAHYLLVKSAKSRVQIKGFPSDFDCVQNLILHYSRVNELMPCRLRTGNEAGNSYHKELRLQALAILTSS